MENILRLYKLNPTYDLYEKIVESNFNNYHKCIYCNNHIYYENTKIYLSKNYDIKIRGNSFNTVKKHGHKLVVCEKCLRNHFSDYDINKKSKIFNTSNKYTIFAFNLSESDIKLYKTGVNEEKLISKYGKIEGLKKWKAYKEKQSLTNTFEYKKQKYGWDLHKFEAFNKSRGITKENLINKYGDKLGIQKWETYIQKQKETKSFDYMVNKFGIDKAKEINKSKALTLSNFINKYGDELGYKKFNNYINKNYTFYSKKSQKLFKEIDKILNNRYEIFYAIKNTEYGVNTSIGYKKLDFYIKDLNICIEFNGDVFHANPIYFKDYDCPNPFNKKLTAKEIWNNDLCRYKTLRNEHNIKTIIIWESDYNNKNFNINKLLNENGIFF